MSPSLVRAEPGFALLLDVAGTVLHPARPVAQMYAEWADAYGVTIAPEVVRGRLITAMRGCRPLRMGDPTWGRYWKEVVFRATGCADQKLFERLYAYYALPEAWVVATEAERCCRRLRQRGMVVGLVSNWDVRLRGLLDALGVTSWVDMAVVSGEIGVEKPDPEIFGWACRQLGVTPSRTLHVGDDEVDDLEGARAAGLSAWLFGRDVCGFEALCRRLAYRPTTRENAR